MYNFAPTGSPMFGTGQVDTQGQFLADDALSRAGAQSLLERQNRLQDFRNMGTANVEAAQQMGNVQNAASNAAAARRLRENAFNNLSGMYGTAVNRASQDAANMAAALNQNYATMAGLFR